MHQALLTGLCQPIETRAPIVFGRAPVGGDPALPFQPLQRRVQRSLLDLEDVTGKLTDSLRDRPAVERFERDGLEDQEIDGALNEIGGLPHDYLQEYGASCR